MKRPDTYKKRRSMNVQRLYSRLPLDQIVKEYIESIGFRETIDFECEAIYIETQKVKPICTAEQWEYLDDWDRLPFVVIAIAKKYCIRTVPIFSQRN